MQEEPAGPTSSPLARDLPQAVSAFVRGLIAAGYSPRTVDATVSDLGQFVTFLGRRGLERVDGITRADVAGFVASLADGSVTASNERGSPPADRPAGRSQQYRPEAFSSPGLFAFLRGERSDRHVSGNGSRITEGPSAPSTGTHGRADGPNARRHEGQYSA